MGQSPARGATRSHNMTPTHWVRVADGEDEIPVGGHDHSSSSNRKAIPQPARLQCFMNPLILLT